MNVHHPTIATVALVLSSALLVQAISDFDFVPLEKSKYQRIKRDDHWDSDDVIGTVDVSEDKINETLKSHMEQSSTDNEKYYMSSPIDFSSAWIDLDEFNRTYGGVVEEHGLLSESYRHAAIVKLKFHFPFYGEDVVNITIATGGFLYTGQYVHSWLAATQYIAPLMANFDTSQDEAAKILHADNGSMFVVEWRNVHLQRNESDKSPSDPFTFQAILRQNGDVTFAYKSVPLDINSIKDHDHPVKVGLSDAYVIDKVIFFVRRKTIYEYHRVSLENSNIANETAIFFKALPTCNRKKSCSECLRDGDSKELKCKWCPSIAKCSDGTDRNHQFWINSGCLHNSLNPNDSLASCIRSNHDDDDTVKEYIAPVNKKPAPLPSLREASESNNSSYHISIATVAMISMILTSLVLWFGYAYFFPHTWSGQILIKYRPTRWHWLRSEPRYTAASIHM